MTVIPENYHSELSLYDTQRAIERIKHIFLAKLCEVVERVSGDADRHFLHLERLHPFLRKVIEQRHVPDAQVPIF